MKDSKQGFASLIILIIVAVAVIGGGAYVYTKQTTKVTPDTSTIATSTINVQATTTQATTTNNKPATDSKPKPKPPVSTTVETPKANARVTIVSKTSTGITYKSDEYGFEFTLPSSYKQYMPTDGPSSDTFIFGGTDSIGRQFSISLAKKWTITQEGYLKHTGMGGDVYVKAPWNVMVGNRAAEKYFTQGDICQPAQNYQLMVKDSHSNNVNIAITFFGGNCVQEQLIQSEVDEILASFKFTK